MRRPDPGAVFLAVTLAVIVGGTLLLYALTYDRGP